MSWRRKIGLWILASRPKTLTAAIVPVLVATAVVHAEGSEVQWSLSALAILSALCIQVGTNFFNDVIDFKKGADSETRLGPTRVVQAGLISAQSVWWAAVLSFVLAAAFAIPLVMAGGWPIVAIGLISLICGYLYTGGPYPLAYRGLGDFFVLVFFGFIAVGGTYFLHTKGLSPGAVVAGLQVGLLATVLIAINNYRDSQGDRAANKLTLAVRFGAEFTRAEILLASFLPFLFGFFWLRSGFVLAGSLPLILLPLAATINRGIRANEPGPIYNRFLAQSAGLHLFFGLFLAIGLFVS